MRLNEVPPAVLELIFAHQTSFLVLMLWQTGDRRLLGHLASGGVQDLQLTAPRIYKLPSKWPGIIKHLRLKSLSITSPYSLGSIQDLRVELLQVHRDLRSLTLTNSGANNALFEPIPSTDDFWLQLKRHSAQRADLTISELQEVESGAKSFPIGDIFPHLEHLSCVGPFTPQKDFILSLPTSITSLELPIANEHVIDLPPHLKRAKLLPQNSDYDALVNLPPSVTSVDCAYHQEWVHTMLSSAALSRLQELEVLTSASFSSSTLRVLSRNLAFKWPRHMHSATFVDCDSLDIAKWPLPPNLSYLHLFLPSNTTPIALDKLILPISLTELRAKSVDWSLLEEGRCELPKVLESLTLSNDVIFGIEHFKLLPRGLKTLSISLLLSEKAIKARNNEPYSSHVSRIWASGVTLLHEDDRDKWLKILALSNYHGGTVRRPFSKANLKAIEKGKLYGLPLTLTTVDLRLTSSSDNSFIDFVLPPHVTSLKVCPRLIGHYQSPNAFFGPLPSLISALSMPTYRNSAEMFDPPLESFPMLTDLGISNSLYPAAETVLPTHLPTTLLALELWQPGRISTETLRRLPQNLIEIRLVGIKIDPCTNWASIMPRTLTKITWYNGSIQGCHLKHLPPSLKSICVNTIFNATTLHLAALPLTLSHLTGVLTSGPGPSPPEKDGAVPSDLILRWRDDTSLCILGRLCYPKDVAITTDQALKLVKEAQALL